MPLYEYRCGKCGRESEILVMGRDDRPACPECGSHELDRLISAHSTASGLGGRSAMPGPGDTACCGSAPGRAAGCAGPGSCCGKA